MSQYPIIASMRGDSIHRRVLKASPYVDSKAPTSIRPVKEGNVMIVDGVNDYLSISNNENFGDNVSWASWVKVTASSTALQTVHSVSKPSNNNLYYAFGVQEVGGTMRVCLLSKSGNFQYSHSTSPIPIGEWVHIACVRASTTNRKFYINGSLINTDTQDQPRPYALTTQTIGVTADASPKYYFGGRLNQVLFASRSLTDNEILSLYNGSSFPNVGHGQCHYGTNSPTTVWDVSGNGRLATHQNGSSSVVDPSMPLVLDKANLEGFTDDAGVIKPRDESDPTNDIDGNPLQYSGSVYPIRPIMRGAYMLTLDGVDDKIVAAHLSGSETVVSSTGTSTPTIGVGEITFDSGTCGDLILSDGTHYPLSEGVGDTVHDIVGGNDGTINNAYTSTEGAGAWAGRIDGGGSNLLNGFSLYENGANKLRIPYVNGAPHPSPTIEAGYTFTSENPPVVNGTNDSEDTIDDYNISENDTPTPHSNANSDLSAIAFDDDLASNDAVFEREVSDVKEDRHIAFPEDLTGNDLTRANRYTNNS